MTCSIRLFTALFSVSFLFTGPIRADEVTLEAQKALVQKLSHSLHDLRVATASAISRTDATANDHQKDLLRRLAPCEVSHIDTTSGDTTFDGSLCPMMMNLRLMRYEIGRNENGDIVEDKEFEQNYEVREEAFAQAAGLKYAHEHTFWHRGSLVSTPVEVFSVSRDMDLHFATGEVVKVIMQTELFKNMESEQITKRGTYTFDFGTHRFTASYSIELDGNDQVSKERIDFAGSKMTSSELATILGPGLVD